MMKIQQTKLSNQMKKESTKKTSSSKLIIEHRGPSIFEVANQVHHTVARYCDYCGRPMTPSDVNDFGSLCKTCYTREYYGY